MLPFHNIYHCIDDNSLLFIEAVEGNFIKFVNNSKQFINSLLFFSIIMLSVDASNVLNLGLHRALPGGWMPPVRIQMALKFFKIRMMFLDLIIIIKIVIK